MEAGRLKLADAFGGATSSQGTGKENESIVTAQDETKPEEDEGEEGSDSDEMEVRQEFAMLILGIWRAVRRLSHGEKGC
jgi:hypothetical protein